MTEYRKKELIKDLMGHYSFPDHLDTVEWRDVLILLLDKMESINPQDLEEFLTNK